MHETGCSGLVHWDDPEGWDGISAPALWSAVSTLAQTTLSVLMTATRMTTVLGNKAASLSR